MWERMIDLGFKKEVYMNKVDKIREQREKEEYARNK